MGSGYIDELHPAKIFVQFGEQIIRFRTNVAVWCQKEIFFFDTMLMKIFKVKVLQLNLNRVATAQGKQGIWFLLFPDRENTGNFALTQGKILRHRENIFL